MNLFNYVFTQTLIICSIANGQRVVIIGGGVSGLSAASHLCSNSLCDLTILEAEDRLGGRLYTDTFHGSLIERGAQWIHGNESNPVFEIISENYTVLPDEKSEYSIYRTSGNPSSSLIEELLSDAEGFVHTINQNIGKSRRSNGTFSERIAMDEGKSLWRSVMKQRGHKVDSYVAEAIFNYTMTVWSLDEGDTAENLGVLSFFLYDYSVGRDQIVPDGYSVLLDILLRNIPKSTIQLGKEVKKIYWHTIGENQTIVEYAHKNGTIQTISADYVIVTVSLGVLKKRHNSMFVPKFSKQRARAIKTMGFGIVNKIFLYYSNPLWQNKGLPITILWDSYKEDDYGEDLHWFKHINVIEGLSDNVLQFWINSYISKATSAYTDADIGRRLTRLIRIVFNDSTIPVPADTFVTRWHQNKHFLGSYSFIAYGQTRLTKCNAIKPLTVAGTPRVLFAGEAMQHGRYSTIDGAYRSGVREANRIRKELRRLQESQANGQ